MELKKSTKVNAISFMDKKHPDVRVFSLNLDMTFEQYLAQCKKPVYSFAGKKEQVPSTINRMLEFDYTLESKSEDGGRSFNLYHYEDDKFISTFIELAA